MVKKKKTIKYRMTLRSPSDKWIVPDVKYTKKNRREIKKALKNALIA